MTDNNPFLALFGGNLSAPSAAPTPIPVQPTQEKIPCKIPDNEDASSVFNELAEKVFRLTLKPQKLKQNQLFYLKDLATALNQESFDQTALDQAVLEYAVGLKDSLVNYLFQCYERTVGLSETQESRDVSKTIFVNLDLAFSQPELFPDQKLHEDFLDLLVYSGEETYSKFIENFIQFCQTQENPTNVEEIFQPIFHCLRIKLASMHLQMGNQNALDVMLVMSKNPVLAKIIVSSSILDESRTRVGKLCEETLLGSLFLCSCIPRIPGTPSDYFDRPSRSPPGVHATTESNIWSASERVMNKVYKVCYNLFKSSPEVQNLTRTWLGNHFLICIISICNYYIKFHDRSSIGSE